MSFKIAVVGSGAIGTYYGARLALAGSDVRFLMRSDLAAARSNGIRLKLPDSELHLAHPQVYAASDEIGPCDLVIITLKTTANAELPRLVKPLIGAQTALLTLQNGLGSDEFLAQHFGAERVLGGLAFIACNRIAPAVVQCLQPGSVTLAEFGRPLSDRARHIAGLFEKAGVKCMPTDNLAEARWRKLFWNIPFNGLSIAAGGITTDRIVGDPALRAAARSLMEEVQGAAARLGHIIPNDFIDWQFKTTDPMGPYKPSSLIDFLEGRPVEVEAIWGEPLRRAQAAGAAVPQLALLYALLRSVTSLDPG
ncbi:MAG TPA: 2-dehydropantoate 2-reductase [Opitutaceae bacterium]|nr:2-dehydropantoate 2-reductase [Opitutaceae bacterium]